jgi:hypothetical protein
MKYFFDTEFIEDGKTVDLLSIGVVAEDGREFYQCNQDAKLDRAGEWVIWNVFPLLGVKHSDRWYWDARTVDVDNRALLGSVVVPHSEIRDRLRAFVSPDSHGKPEFWAYYADYDWVVLCQLFGRMIDLPKGWPMYCNDVKQLAMMKGNPKLPEQASKEHHALEDARWTKQAYEFLLTVAEIGA